MGRGPGCKKQDGNTTRQRHPLLLQHPGSQPSSCYRQQSSRAFYVNQTGSNSQRWKISYFSGDCRQIYLSRSNLRAWGLILTHSLWVGNVMPAGMWADWSLGTCNQEAESSEYWCSLGFLSLFVCLGLFFFFFHFNSVGDPSPWETAIPFFSPS